MRVRRDLAVKDLPLNRSTHGPQTGFEEIATQPAFADTKYQSIALQGHSVTAVASQFSRKRLRTDTRPLTAIKLPSTGPN
jgi:hypothetical protein